jgi:S-adenosylmethionine hydrolase
VQLITFTTDFGTEDWFAGTMKGVALGIHPRATIVDLTPGVPPGDIRGGAFALAAGYSFFPAGTVHVAIVDPGVGSARAGIAVRTANYFFVGPDNGVLSFALARETIKAIRRLDDEKYFLQPVSRTFHGRDVFAPVAAHLSRGVSIGKLGPAQNDFVRLRWPKPRKTANAIEGEIIYVDRFGNAITNLPNDYAEGGSELTAGSRRVGPVKSFYQAVPVGRAVVVPGSSGFLEIAIHNGSAARKLGIGVGDRVRLNFK